MIAVGILLMSLVILVGAQTSAIEMTVEADRLLVATQLAQDKLAEVRVQVESEGFQLADVHEEGDFDDFGDEALNLELESLEDYHWEYLVTEIDLRFAGGLQGAVGNLTGALGISSEAIPGGIPDLGALGIGEELITQQISPCVRELVIRVWWGDDLEEAEELGNQVVLTQHVTDVNVCQVGLGGGGAPPGGQQDQQRNRAQQIRNQRGR
ncbi:MAG: hypothetical protein H6732_17555 [Alphaproteobacteria bacterium]|nr:hypothetical protein [Alphaproteobacteria bacterium]